MPTYKSNLSDVVNKIDLKLESVENTDKLIRTLATNLLASNQRRIHNDGKDVNLANIGGAEYSTTPTYVSLDQMPVKKKGRGKNSSKPFKNGNPRKSRYYAGGYKGFRSDQRRQTSKVDLRLTGRLQSDLVIAEKKNSWVVGFATDYGVDISNGMEEKYKQRIWGVSKDDDKMISLEVSDFVKKQLK